MPCYQLLGIEICIPTIDDIVNAVVAPINNFVASRLTELINVIVPYFQGVVNLLRPHFQVVIDTIINFLRDPLATIQRIIGDTFSYLSTVKDAIYDRTFSIITLISLTTGQIQRTVTDVAADIVHSLSGAIGNVTTGFFEAITYSQNVVSSTVNIVGSELSGMIESGQTVLMTAFNGMGDAISGVIGAVFEGFGKIPTDQVMGGHADVSAMFQTAIETLGLTHSPLTPEEAASFVSSYIFQVGAAVAVLSGVNITAEVISGGQVDMCLSDVWKQPNVAGATGLAADFLTMPLREGLGPAFKRYILSSYQPNIPPYMDLISIYVKEGYLPDHWVELPGEMVENFQELGYNEYWTRRLWGKHWQYPSPSMLYDMLHRTAGTRPEIGVTTSVLRNMLKLHDYEPKWRGPLEAISWRTWRIYDVRTEWEMTEGGDPLLIKRLIDQGYEPRDAVILAEVQKLFVLRSEIDALTREADADFIDGWITEAQLRADYAATPYNPDVVELRVARAILRRERELKKDIKAALIDRFIKGDLTEAEFRSELGKLGVIAEWISAEVARASARKLKKVTVAG